MVFLLKQTSGQAAVSRVHIHVLVVLLGLVPRDIICPRRNHNDDEVFIFPGGSYLMITDKDGDMTLYRLDSAGPERLGTLLYSARGERGSRERRLGQRNIAAHQFLQDGTVLQIVTLTKTAYVAHGPL